MKNQRWIWVLVLAVAVAMPLAAGEKHKCTSDTQTCLNKMAAKFKERGWVGVELDDSEESGALTVVRVEPESPAMRAGIREGDVLLAVNGVAYSDENHDALYEIKKAMRVGKSITYTVDRQGCCHIKGGKQEIEVTLAEIPEEIMAKWIGRHMMEHVAIEVAQH